MYSYTKKFYNKKYFFHNIFFFLNISLYLNKIAVYLHKFLNLIFSKMMVRMKKLFFLFDFCTDKNILYLSSYHPSYPI